MVNVTYPKNEKILICANFASFDKPDSEIKENDVITYEKLKNKKNSLFPYYFGTITKNKMIYEINSKLDAWTMNDRLSKDYPQHSFNVYLLVKVNNTKSDYRCVCITKSSSFSVISSRRCRYKKSNDEESSSVDILGDDLSLELDNSVPCQTDTLSPTDIKSESITESVITNNDHFNYELRLCDDIKRLEITCYGFTLEEAKEKAKIGYEYLDKYGNKHTLKADFDDEVGGYLSFYE